MCIYYISLSPSLSLSIYMYAYVSMYILHIHVQDSASPTRVPPLVIGGWVVGDQQVISR